MSLHQFIEFFSLVVKMEFRSTIQMSSTTHVTCATYNSLRREIITGDAGLFDGLVR